MTRRLTKKEREALERAGNRDAVRTRIARYSQAVSRLSSEHATLIKKYPNRWVAMHDGEVIAANASQPRLINQCKKLGYYPDGLAMRFLDTEKRVMVL